MTGESPTLVVLAAGLGTRFGGLKQLVAVGPQGATITDVLLCRAAAAGFERAVIVVGPGMVEAVRDHLDDVCPELPVHLAVQRLVPGRSQPLGTADAVLAAREQVRGSFVVVNADDVYPADAFALAAAHLRDAPPNDHALIAFRVGRTLAGTRPVSRAFVAMDAAAHLVSLREGTVVVAPDGLRFDADGASTPLRDDQPVSMNMWVFRVRAFDAFAGAVADFVAGGCAGEVWLPDVVTAMVAAGAGAVVRVIVSEGRCIGMTHTDDIAAVRAVLS